MSLKTNKQWLAAADAIKAQGYTQTTTDDPLLPVVFVRGAERIYLYAPLRTRAAGAGRRWVARKVKEMPKLFGTRDIAEHFGLTIAHVQFEYYRGRRLHPSQRIGTRGALLATREDLIAWLGRRRPPGRPKTERHRTLESLSRFSDRRLWQMYKKLIESGELAPFTEEEMEMVGREELIEYLAKKENQ